MQCLSSYLFIVGLENYLDNEFDNQVISDWGNLENAIGLALDLLQQENFDVTAVTHEILAMQNVIQKAFSEMEVADEDYPDDPEYKVEYLQDHEYVEACIRERLDNALDLLDTNGFPWKSDAAAATQAEIKKTAEELQINLALAALAPKQVSGEQEALKISLALAALEK